MKYRVRFEVRRGSGREDPFTIDFEADDDENALREGPLLGHAGGKLAGIYRLEIQMVPTEVEVSLRAVQ